MKHINFACLNTFFKKIALLLILFSAFNFAHAQCPTPYAVGTIDSTLRNTPVSTVVTRNVYISYSSFVLITNDSLYISGSPSHGTAVVLNDSTIQYTPFASYIGNDIYTYTVCNSCGNCVQGTVAIQTRSYCPAPVAVADHYNVYNNQPISLNVTSNDQNVASGPLTLSIRQNPVHGSLTLAGTQVVYTSNNNSYLGPDTFVYLIRDTCPGGNNSDSAYVYLNVITCQPVVANNDAFTVQQQSSVSGNVAANDVNATGFGNTTVTLLNTPKYSGTAIIAGTMITYTGGPNGYGLDSIRYRICTDCGCDSAYAIYRVTPKSCSMPTAVPDTEYAGYSVHCMSIFNILGNDTIPINGGTLTVALTSTPMFGSATIINGTLHYICTDSTKVGRMDVVRYSICNACFCDTSYVVINITNYPCNGINPVVKSDTADVCVNYPVSINVTANDYSPQGLSVTARAITNQGVGGTAIVVNGSTIRYTPNHGFTGTDQFVYQACDNGSPSLCDSAIVTIRVAACAAPPQILNTAGNPTDTLHVSVYEDSSRMYCFTYIHTDSPQVLITHIGASLDTVYATSATPGINPCVHIAPPTNSRTEQSIQVIICNETPTCDTVTLIISVIPVDHAPVARMDSIFYNWSAACDSVNVLNNDSDVDQGDQIHISSFDSVTGDGGLVSIIGDSTFCYTADSSFTGTDVFRYTICDTSHLCATTYVTVIVPLQARNDFATTKQDSTVSINLTANDTRASHEYISLCSQPQHGSATLDSNVLVYTPVHDYPVDPIANDTLTAIGMDSFCYILCHVVGADTTCARAEVYVMVLPKARFYIPQGISPNGDGVNDKFFISSADEFPLSQLLVYNRYGDEVWRNDGDGYQNDFDGTWKKNGQPLPDGSYWYIFKFNDGVTHDRMGYIVIQR